MMQKRSLSNFCLTNVRNLKVFLEVHGRDIEDSEYDQEIPQSQTADNLVAPRGRAALPSRDTRKTN